ncbi:hypothetical protein [Sporosarcina sp. HYO08]|uniref:hypothetical protein n=1 Tax=Sporosarcina sp. HYO08 TaxID=1759557 RepID=UPI00079155F6|nr:hypothetical protein [Sporosarcina sp. HYO08]KXH82070.1 hypothetical protein AU377_07410 [Sporosarcina sp. HYO08]
MKLKTIVVFLMTLMLVACSDTDGEAITDEQPVLSEYEQIKEQEDLIVKHIADKNYEEASDIIPWGILENSEKIRILNLYAAKMDLKEKTGQVTYGGLHVKIPPDYDGEFKDEIRAFMLESEIPYEEWERRYNDHKNREYERKNKKVAKTAEPIPYEPAIGMTDYEVRESTWGKPQKINKTTTRYGVSEQWVYPNYKYLYFEDGYLVTIQE